MRFINKNRKTGTQSRILQHVPVYHPEMIEIYTQVMETGTADFACLPRISGILEKIQDKPGFILIPPARARRFFNFSL